ncbi:MAG: phosphate ABC transporter permease subunit PstC [Phenylobacterium sp.]|uniref:phosphate ABC transporter permease subunit PstC n=1 Tax=Phenylobacterium sp. TaxID=1871053 RepID=UPI001A3CFE8F|nr:phosphate ABC transporter permease subunit PstC [Phenylobacterium sp.]MBL8553387.1 phosphate ABC transporter permease subunit PstC [Phenylobacterium sp.]
MTAAADTPPAATVARGRSRLAQGAAFDGIFEYLCLGAATFLLLALGGIVISLVIGGWPAFARFGLGFFTSAEWDPVQEIFGASGAIAGTLISSALALLLALPLSFGIAIFLVELCPPVLRRPIGTAVELLAGIPSIVYGMWGLFVFAPWFAKHVQIPIMMSAKPGAFWEAITAGVPNGAGILTASIILAIMILPFIAATMRELLLTMPPQVRESAYGLGSTTFEVIRKVSLPYIRTGAIGAVMLGLGRALGETMAVTFIIGNAHGFPTSIFASGSTIASTIANEFAEAPPGLHSASLIALGLVLFIITFTVLALARLLIGRQANL